MSSAPDDFLSPLQQLEQQLLHTDFSKQPLQLDRLLADDFQEVSPAGHISTREQVISWLLHKDPMHRWQFSQWQCSELSTSVRLLRYHAVQCAPPSQSKGAQHVSIWRFNHNQECWQLHFHQSSKVG